MDAVNPTGAAPGDRTLLAGPCGLDAAAWAMLCRRALERAGVAHALVGPDGTVLFASPALSELVGIPNNHLVGRPVTDWLVATEHYGVLGPVGSTGLRRVLPVDGAPLEVDLQADPVPGEGGRVSAHALWVRVAPEDSADSADPDAVDSLVGFASALAGIEHAATHDPLTDVLNRMAITERVGALVDDGTDAGLFLVDLDGFSRMNDNFGHRHGDEVLRMVADRLALNLRDDAEIGRLGADEFLVVAPGVTDRSAMEAIARRLGTAVADLHPEGSLPHPSTVSSGAVAVRAGAAAEQCMNEAQLALDRARRSGPGRWLVMDDAVRSHMDEADRLDSELRIAVDSQRIATWYQPVVDLVNGRCVGWEALARWVLLDGTVRPAGEFIDRAGSSGTLEEVGRTVVHDAARRTLRTPPDTVVSVNLGADELDGDVMEHLAYVVDHFEVPPGRMAIEMGAPDLSALDGTRAARLQRGLDAGLLLYVHNVELQVDVVGLCDRYPVGAVKLGRQVTSGLQRGLAGRDMVEQVADLAALLRVRGVVPIAEGVEDRDQSQLLRHAGWRFGQGYLLGPPAPAAGGRMPRARNPMELTIS